MDYPPYDVVMLSHADTIVGGGTHVRAGGSEKSLPCCYCSRAGIYNTDDRTLEELMIMITDELADITFSHSLQIIVDAMLSAVTELFRLTEEQLCQLSESILG